MDVFATVERNFRQVSLCCLTASFGLTRTGIADRLDRLDPSRDTTDNRNKGNKKDQKSEEDCERPHGITPDRRMRAADSENRGNDVSGSRDGGWLFGKESSGNRGWQCLFDNSYCGRGVAGDERGLVLLDNKEGNVRNGSEL